MWQMSPKSNLNDYAVCPRRARIQYTDKLLLGATDISFISGQEDNLEENEGILKRLKKRDHICYFEACM